jgi:hypothetical protein
VARRDANCRVTLLCIREVSENHRLQLPQRAQIGTIEATGLEPANSLPSSDDRALSFAYCKDGCDANALPKSGVECRCLSSRDCELREVIAAWNALPAAVRAGIMLLIRS